MRLTLDVILFAWNQGAWGNAPKLTKAKITTTTEVNKQKSEMIAHWICYSLWSHLRNVQRPQMPEPISRFIALLLHTIVSILRRCLCILFFALQSTSLFPFLIVLFFYFSNSISLSYSIVHAHIGSKPSRSFHFYCFRVELSFHFIWMLLLSICFVLCMRNVFTTVNQSGRWKALQNKLNLLVRAPQHRYSNAIDNDTAFHCTV